jgi:adenine-specific DNA-methyltransferase
MPTLHWIGKEKVINHHLAVPFKVLEHKYGFDNGNSGSKEIRNGNKIIHGDNLEALKALLPEYEGRIKCIYIDPPYNTGNEGWVYNDNVSDPKIKKWLHELVGKEGEDLSRHDKWLCMMYPRLKLLHKLLADDGAIFISIDDNEHTFLKLICDEIFGNRNYVSSFIWRRRASSQMSQNNISVDHEYVVTYFKSPDSKFYGVKKDYKNYSNPDDDPRGDWTLGDLTVGMTKDQRPNQFFDLHDPQTGRVFEANSKRVWTYAPDTMNEKIKEGRVVFPKSKTGRPMLKRYLRDLKSDINPLSTWMSNEAYGIGLNSEGTKLIQSLFEDKIFDYPKPLSLIQRLLAQLTTDKDIVLDSFAGSGTTAHAVLNLNKQDGGSRKFILIEMEEYAETITAERVKRVVNGYGDTEGTGGSFDFYSLGQPLFTENGTLNDSAGIEKMRRYIFYTETQTFLNGNHYEDNPYLLGLFNNTAYYFQYDAEGTTTLNHDFLNTIRTKAEQYIIYADNCLLTKEFMAKRNISFKKIPRDITLF